MPADYYNDSEEEMPMHDTKEAPAEEADERDEKTATLPKWITAGKDFEPGDEIVLEVVAVHEDEIEVKYAKEKGDKGEDYGESEQPSMARAMDSNKAPSSMMDEMY